MQCLRAFALSPVFLFGLVLMFTACGETTTLPSSVGGLDEVLFVEDPRFLNDTLYDQVDARLQAQFGNFLHFEPIFDLLTRTQDSMSKTLEKHRNMVFVAVLNTESDYNTQVKALIGTEGVEAVREKGALVAERRNVWASGQHVHLIVTDSKERLARLLPSALDETVRRIQSIEAEKYKRFVYAGGTNVPQTEDLKDNYDIVLRIPDRYDLHESSNGNFRWYRRSTLDLTASIMVYQHPYRRELETQPAYAVFVRDSLGKRYERSATPGAYMSTEKLVRPIVDTVDLNGHFAIRTQSLWRLVGDFMGGPFVNYLIYDQVNNRIIHLDAYVYAPDITRKRKLVRELDAILQTFDIPGAVVNG